ncbi:MAG: helix-turn-helix domain-containing protein [Tepidimonas taiwanensis]|nr:helix-turn-helix domain-containing protein [Tepidimonas taiwanensis]
MHADSFPTRLRQCIGDEAVAAFARRCGISEGLIRSYLKAEKQPGMDRLIRIADAAGVSLEWLATGRGPMRRDHPKPAPDKDFSAVPYARRLEKLGLLLGGLPEQEAADLLDEMFARAHEASKRRALEQALTDLRAEVERLKKSA